eukprot:2687449-Pleurochrysis_carterae.AAC.2
MRRLGGVGTFVGLVGTVVRRWSGCGGDGYARRRRRHYSTGGGRRVLPGIRVLVEVHIRGEHNARHTGNEDVVGPRRGKAASKVRAHPGTRFDACLRISGARLSGEGPATKGEDRHDAGFRPAVSASYDQIELRGGPVVRLSTSTEWDTA